MLRGTRASSTGARCSRRIFGVAAPGSARVASASGAWRALHRTRRTYSEDRPADDRRGLERADRRPSARIQPMSSSAGQSS